MNSKRYDVFVLLLLGAFLIGLNFEKYFHGARFYFQDAQVWNHRSERKSSDLNTSANLPVKPSANLPVKPSAKSMLKEKFGSETPFMGDDPADTAKYLNFITYNHCSSELPHTVIRDISKNDLFELFSVCRTACGGYAYVLRELLAAHGINSRYVNLYNLPQQGNHTMVEVEIKRGKFALFDPTFGVYFTSTGSINERPLSLEEVRYSLRSNTIKKNVLQAGKIPFEKSLDRLYSQVFSAEHMNLENYLVAEQSAPAGVDSIVPLVMPIVIVEDRAESGILSFNSKEEGLSKFLKWTDQTLNNENPQDDVSSLFHVVGKYNHYFDSLNLIKITNLTIGSEYEIKFFGYSNQEHRIQVFGLGRDVSISGPELRLNKIEPEFIKPGKFVMSRKFWSASESAEIVFHKSDKDSDYVYLFGVLVYRITR